MLFFWGTGTSLLGTYPLPGISCVYCGTAGSVRITVYSRYMHLFWVPLIPLGKNAVSQCAHCQQVLTQAQMPPAYRAPALAWQQSAKIPVSNYLVLGILGVAFFALVLVGALQGNRQPAARQLGNVVGAAPSAMREAMAEVDPATNEPLLAAPQVADLYAMRNPDHHYSVMRVARVAADTLYLQTSTYRPETLLAVDTERDSVLHHLNTFLVPMPRNNMQAINQTKLLTVIRK